MRVLIANIYGFVRFVFTIFCWIFTLSYIYRKFGLIGSFAGLMVLWYIPIISLVLAAVNVPIEYFLCMIFKAPPGAFSSKSGLIMAYQRTHDPKYLEMLANRKGEDLQEKTAEASRCDNDKAA